MRTATKNYAAALRQELLKHAETFVANQRLEAHVYRSLGKIPTVLFRGFESDGKACHGNFHEESYAAIIHQPAWASRLQKAHSGKSRCFLENDAVHAREMDSCTSSDALGMNIFCHPSITTNKSLAKLFGFDVLPTPNFGFKAKLPLVSGGFEPTSTEIDLRLQSSERTILAECKLTESDFTARPREYVERYTGVADTFNISSLPQKDGQFLHYQLIRNVLAARYHEACFFLICDKRRPDLQEAFAEVVSAITDPKLKDRCTTMTWQKITWTLPRYLQLFISMKYGIDVSSS